MIAQVKKKIAQEAAHKQGSAAIHSHKNKHAQGLIRFGFSHNDLTNLMTQNICSDVGLDRVEGKSFAYTGKNPNKPILSSSSKAMLGSNQTRKASQA